MVYLPNTRGNRYSRAHKTIDPDIFPRKFFNFSWFEMGMYDLPAVIDSVIERSGKNKIPCVGHSQGGTKTHQFVIIQFDNQIVSNLECVQFVLGTIFLVLLSMRPEFNDKISLVSLLASFSYMDKVGFPINSILRLFHYLLPFRNREFVRNSVTQQILAKVICNLNHGSLCNAAINFVLGPSVDQKNDVSCGHVENCAL